MLPEKQSSGLELPKVIAVTSKSGLCELDFDSNAAAAILAELSKGAVLVHNVALTSKGGLSVLVDGVESQSFVERHPGAVRERGLSSVSIVGQQLQNNTVVAARLIAALEGAGIRPAGLTCHPQSITVWFSESTETSSARAVQLLHRAFIEE